MQKCICGFKTWNKHRFKRHQRKCEVYLDGQSKTRPAERQEVKEELVEAQTSQTTNEVQDEGIEFEEMTVNELRELAKAEGMTGIYSKSKAELIEALREGE